jgi:ketosteroid isomerase-like protein
MPDERSGVLEAFRRYTQSFQALDARAVAQHFHEPAVFITPKEIVALPTVEAVEQAYAQVMANMPADYVRTEFSQLSAHRLSDDLAMVSGGGTWKNAADEDLMPFGMTYTLHRSGETWRIVVAAIHAPDGGPGSSFKPFEKAHEPASKATP